MLQNENYNIPYFDNRNNHHKLFATEISWKSDNSGWFGGTAAPPSEIRSSDMCGARMNFCGAELALREQKFFPYAFAARESRRDDRQRRGGSR